MKLLTETIRKQLLRNGVIRLALEEKGEAEADFVPVVKLLTPDAGCTWLLSEIDPEDQDIAFGLCDLGMSCPELGTVRISELESVRGRLGLPICESALISAPQTNGGNSFSRLIESTLGWGHHRRRS